MKFVFIKTAIILFSYGFLSTKMLMKSRRNCVWRLTAWNVKSRVKRTHAHCNLIFTVEGDFLWTVGRILRYIHFRFGVRIRLLDEVKIVLRLYRVHLPRCTLLHFISESEITCATHIGIFKRENWTKVRKQISRISDCFLIAKKYFTRWPLRISVPTFSAVIQCSYRSGTFNSHGSETY